IRIGARAGAALNHDPAAVGVGVGHVDAVLAHAPGERQQLLLLLRAGLGGLAAVWQVLLAGLLRRLERRVVRAFAARTRRELLGDPLPVERSEERRVGE